MKGRVCVQDGTIRSHPPSTGKVRSNLIELLRSLGLSPDKVLRNDGFLDDADIRKVKKRLRSRQKCNIKLVTI